MPGHTVSRRPATQSLPPLLGFVKRRYNTVLLILSFVLIVLAGLLVYLLDTQTFKPYFNCKYLIDDALHTQNLNTSLCNGAAFNTQKYEILPALEIPGLWKSTPVAFGPLSIPVLPAIKPIDGPLETARKFVAWNIILVFALASLALAYGVIKLKDFFAVLLTPEGRRMILTNLSIWLLIFAVLCSLFYFWVVAGGG